MTKHRSDNNRLQNRKALDEEPKAKLSSRTSAKSGSSVARRKPGASKGGKVHLHQNDSQPPTPVRPIPWWVVPEEEQRMLPPSIGGPGQIPGGPGGGPGHFPGPGGPGGPGHFPPPPPPRPPFPGPGPFPPGPFPGPGPFPPGPFPVPIPIPIPIPPQPFPPVQNAFIAVTIAGGASFPGVNVSTFIPFFPGITIRQALQSTGLVGFGPGGFITNVGNIPVGLGSNADVRVFYNGRIIPQTLLGAPAQPGSTIRLELFYSILPLPTPF